MPPSCCPGSALSCTSLWSSLTTMGTPAFTRNPSGGTAPGSGPSLSSTGSLLFLNRTATPCGSMWRSPPHWSWPECWTCTNGQPQGSWRSQSHSKTKFWHLNNVKVTLSQPANKQVAKLISGTDSLSIKNVHGCDELGQLVFSNIVESFFLWNVLEEVETVSHWSDVNLLADSLDLVDTWGQIPSLRF